MLFKKRNLCFNRFLSKEALSPKVNVKNKFLEIEALSVKMLVSKKGQNAWGLYALFMMQNLLIKERYAT